MRGGARHFTATARRVVDLRHYRRAIFFARLRGVVQFVVDDSTISNSMIVEEIH
jgi:hypothetical protein